MSFVLERTCGPFVQLVTLSEVSTATMTSGYVTSKRLSAVSPTHFQTDTNTATTRISVSVSARKAVTTWLESIKEDVISCTVSNN